ncbi:MAG: trehalase family glycosidase [Flavobacteriaceae bacterium]|nr:trehalase family glycosidase [Flavobacteriaceae bacterium]MDZ4148226.1 trehalase family glycosidase [Flavobacteriaceae bacterium]
MKFLFFLPILMIIPAFSIAQNKEALTVDFDALKNTHDIHLSAWGPYSKKYAGISHIDNTKAGMRFDFSVLPGYYRNKILIPNVNFESGYFPWESNKELTRYTYRYELEWKDKVYVDVTYTVIDSLSVLVAMRCVNNTSLPQNLSMNLVYGIEYPEVFSAYKLMHPENAVWINAVDYTSLDFAQTRPRDGLVYDGWMRGEVRSSDFIDGSAIGQNFGKDPGDKATYQVKPGEHNRNGILTLWYRMPESESCTFQLSGLANQTIILKGLGELSRIDVPYRLLEKGNQTLTLTSLGGDAVELNGILFSPPGGEVQAKIVMTSKSYAPEMYADIKEKKLISKYKDISTHYGIRWDGDDDFRVRQIKNDELDIFFRRLVHSHVDSILKGNYKGDYSNVFIRPIELLPRSEKTIHGIIATGSLAGVRERLDKFDELKGTIIGREKAVDDSPEILSEGKKYLFSRNMLKATVLSDIVYPVYTQRDFIRHFTPGKWWNSLYTWDSGFIALGLNEVNPDLAAQVINAYTTPVGNQSAFIHHGSPVPTQFYAFQDLWNKTQSKEALQYFYPRLKQYYEFMVGRLGSSTTNTLQSGLLKTWDYFYNSGGWDDYPAQMEVHRQKAEQTVAPVINTAQQIRLAKIMRMAASALGQKTDIAVYDKDIKNLSVALQKYAWNESSGYFSYVEHDAKGNPAGKLMYRDTLSKQEIDFNMGMDGAYPLVAGICTPAQQQGLMEKIFSDKNMWTPAGISVVDQSAPYYKIDGYWNGSVWMPHQWFIWKTMLDLGRPELAFKIANKALEVYSKETNESYYTFEHFLAKSGRGAGWHQFSGLSAPVLSWFSAYYVPGTVTTGFEIWIKSQSFNKEKSTYTADLVFDNATSAHSRSMLMCLNPAYSYKVTFNGKEIQVESPYPGLLQINFPNSNKGGTLIIENH